MDSRPIDSLDALQTIAARPDLPEELQSTLKKLSDEYSRLRADLDIALHDVSSLSEQVQAQERREQRLEKQLLYNRKSGLPNHFVLDNDLNAFIREAHGVKSPRNIGVMIVALDSAFEMAHKALDREYSDWIVYECAGRIQEQLPKNGRLYHTRDNEFVLLIIGIDSNVNLKFYADQVTNVVSDTFKFPEYTVRIGCNIGSSCFPHDGVNKSTILRSADIALSNARHLKKGYLAFHERMQSQVIEKMELQDAIIRALEEQAIVEIGRQFSLFFQPYFAVSQENGYLNTSLLGAEALIRWQHPRRGLVDPGRFIPVAEESGLIIPIGSWTLFRAAEHILEWRDSGIDALSISVNLSPRQFKDENLVQTVEAAINRSGVSPERLRLEITEGSVMDDLDEGQRKLRAISEMGIRILIDDFGTGHSSLNYLRRLPIHGIKLDKSFIDDLLRSSHTQGIIRAVQHMAQDMGIEIIAEGVESYQQAEYLAGIGPVIIQGYLFGKPMPVDEFRVFAEASCGKTVAYSEENH